MQERKKKRPLTLNFHIHAAVGAGGWGALQAVSGLAQVFTLGKSRLDQDLSQLVTVPPGDIVQLSPYLKTYKGKERIIDVK